MSKYQLVCKKCGKVIGTAKDWFENDQLCTCGSNYATVEYFSDYAKLNELLKAEKVSNFYHYKDFLPIENDSQIFSLNEGAVDIQEWSFLEKEAKEHNIDCRVLVVRNDQNGGTGTFKDIAASLAATMFKENGVTDYCLASTGNTATAYSTYLAKAGIKFHLFAPCDMYPDSINAIKATGQEIIISKGNYGAAKKEAAEFHKANNVMISAGNIDPIRVEAKKTLVFECIRQLGQMPTVYMQAVAGGTSPIAFNKGMDELHKIMPECKMPRMLLVQQDTCDPMVQAWEWAVENRFPEGYQEHYPSITPTTKISILSAGTPGMYPIVAPIVKKSNGSFVRIKEEQVVRYGYETKKETGICFGPASVVCIAGFHQAVKDGLIKNGDTVLLNIGEGSGRAAWFRDAVENYNE
ncbi:MAG: pyridoxal-phosphate dependent enzyme [Bacteroidaceae bacterium]|nr:pyridoxal-phosphate dependent enzyme [Bacteroidaceae bacterium]